MRIIFRWGAKSLLIKKPFIIVCVIKAMDKMILPLPLPTTKILHEKNVSRILASFCKIPSKHTTLFQRQCLRCWRPNNVVCLLSIIDLHIFRFTLSVEKSKRRMLRVRHFLMKGTEQFIFVALGDVVLLGSFVYEYTFFQVPLILEKVKQQYPWERSIWLLYPTSISIAKNYRSVFETF